MILLLYLQLALTVFGLTFLWIASTKRTELHPYHSNCETVNPFKRQSWYTPIGYKYHISGFLMIYTGILLQIFYHFIK